MRQQPSNPIDMSWRGALGATTLAAAAMLLAASAASAQVQVAPLEGALLDLHQGAQAPEGDRGTNFSTKFDRGQASCGLGSITCGSTVTGMLTDQDCDVGDGTFVDFWDFAGSAGQTITVNLMSNDFDANIGLLDPAFNIVAADDNGGNGTNSRLVFTLTSEGPWTIGANTIGAGATGNYTLSLQCSAVPGVPATPQNLTATATSMNEIRIEWDDNSNNEQEFRVEIQTGGVTGGPFVDVGGLPTDATGARVSPFAPGTLVNFRVRARNANGTSNYSNVATATTWIAPGSTCTANATTLCLNNDRFAVTTSWRRTNGLTGVGTGVELTNDTGYFWFFNPANVEMVVKVLNGCPSPFNSYWVFAGGLTNVEVVMTVADTQSGQVQTYVNPITMPFQPIQDTEAFATCP